jgi:hypothetical protein
MRYLCVWSFWLVAAGGAWAESPAAVPRAGTFYEEIFTVQTSRGRPAAAGRGQVSIPYTRIDVALENGVALSRVLQIYHNHGGTNQGFAFTLPLLPDTTITHFHLWDEGKRYRAAIEERTRAEQAYKETTGEEAPTMNRDPGLVRRTQNRYEMRVFPILPGEDKQIELFSHRRLGMKDGEFVLSVPVRDIARPFDARHGQLTSGVVEVSVFIQDELPIRSVTVTGGELKETVVDAHSRLLAGKLSPEGLANLEVRLALNVPSAPVVTPQVFTQDGQQYFLMRVVGRPPPAQKLTTASPRHFYVGVWKPGVLNEATIETRPEEAMAMEMFAFLTLAMLQPDDQFHGAYWPPRLRGRVRREMPGFQATATCRPYRVVELERALGETLGAIKEGTKPTTNAVDVVQDLRQTLQDKQYRLAYLFLGDLPADTASALAAIIHEHGDCSFILVTKDGQLPAGVADAPNVSQFSMRDGWLAVRHPDPSGTRQLLSIQEWSLAELQGALGTPARAVVDFWQRLPNFGGALPMLETSGDVQLRDVQTFSGRAANDTDAPTNELTVIWLSGRYEGKGRANFTLSMPGRSADWIFAASNQTARIIRASTRLDEKCRQNRLVAAFHARQLAEGLDAQIAALARSAGGRRGLILSKQSEADRAARLAALRKEVVRLSKSFSFISAETAFIALPPELQKKYGITAQELSAHQYYEAEQPETMITPEPETWQLLLGGAAALALFLWKRRRALSHRQGAEFRAY